MPVVFDRLAKLFLGLRMFKKLSFETEAMLKHSRFGSIEII